MIVIPAIDIMDGNIVRLVKGDPNQKSVYRHYGDPVSIAVEWEKVGARYIHVIDLDAALGRGNNESIIYNILNSVHIPIQLGGGIRSFESAKKFLDAGIYRIILGSLAVNDNATFKKLLNEYGSDRIAVSVDHFNGYIKIKGWTETTQLDILSFMSKMKELGTDLFLLTNIDRDGTLSEPDYYEINKVLKIGKIMAAGGISDLTDLEKLSKIGVYAAVIGKALYENKFSLKQALKVEAQ
ncbi:1-(5-phosphoribosyl)-5-[(5-phosphoribosylamino)methylideneamino]imidazole-4-carboxamide isomerase [Candidatus Bathyarchaeota archaeon]|nr:1-(5-phosphoribosyl)-5-[(5-phosphoribosylamino)methylideneamino]imidazole-4-carboxamide isomerase [Candidatus Bathyarchaeota archaeon]